MHVKKFNKKVIKNSKRPKNFLVNQIEDVRKNGFIVLFKKLSKIPLFLLAILVIFLVRLLRPFVTIRFGPLASSRIGQFALETEIYLCQHVAGMHERKTLDFFYYVLPICNQQLKKMFNRNPALHISYFAYWFDKVNRLLP